MCELRSDDFYYDIESWGVETRTFFHQLLNKARNILVSRVRLGSNIFTLFGKTVKQCYSNEILVWPSQIETDLHMCLMVRYRWIAQQNVSDEHTFSTKQTSYVFNENSNHIWNLISNNPIVSIFRLYDRIQARRILIIILCQEGL